MSKPRPIANSTQNAQSNAYLRNRVLNARPEEIRLMLLDGAIRFGRQAQAGIEAKDIEQMFDGLSQCRDIVAELLGTVRDDPDPELAQNVRGLYSFMFRELMDVGFERDGKKLAKVIELLEYERETWAMLCEKLAAERASAGPSAPAEQRTTGVSLQA